ncbi:MULTISPECIES: metallophosphoesterase [Clostridia]|jgi:predicted phosphohydrolase|uniref:Metallophosphoesterase n=1 Tax=Butyribacter intestini TaxID=1703332 RepID=A0AAW3JR51_9FIRM|nr:MULTISPECIES: metallophosphoesterase [Clostridia]KQC85216.1 metallophosphoesterase [Butyribacter intestini]RHP26121.1 metallophosphoesterase [Clostridium sp. AF34-13]RHU74497.1 metallophosphoesterase [Butyribacter intestini]
MSLYAIGDLHLSFESDKSMERFGDEWKDHPKKIKDNWHDIVKETDTVVITGDHSWGKRLEDSMKDLEFIAGLPGRKILLRGNHDRFWNKTSKTDSLNELFVGKLLFLQDNFYEYEDDKSGKKYALIGSKGFSTDEYCFLAEDKIEKRFKNERKRLIKSYEAARCAGYDDFLMFLHYPPTNVHEKEGMFTELAREFGAEQVVYSHLHGKERFDYSIIGEHDGINYTLVSSDYLDFKPKLIK